MRADRLVAILLMLQARGRVTAAEVAEDLEISERTARRDLDALGVAGLPIYSRQGRNGGWELIGGARTDLTGLTGPEARALFLVAGPSSSATPEVKAALRKLIRALPEPFREDAAAASAAVVIDRSAWGAGTVRPTPPFLEALQTAVVDGCQVVLGYVARDRQATERIVHPLGLAAKGPTWYLVGDTDAGLRTFRIDRVTSVEQTGDRVVRPDGFDLAEAWKMITEQVNQHRHTVRARGFAQVEMLGVLRMVFGTRLGVGPTGPDGRVEVEFGGAHDRALAGELAGFGSAVEVVEPPEIRALLATIARELIETYPPG